MHKEVLCYLYRLTVHSHNSETTDWSVYCNVLLGNALSPGIHVDVTLTLTTHLNFGMD